MPSRAEDDYVVLLSGRKRAKAGESQSDLPGPPLQGVPDRVLRHDALPEDPRLSVPREIHDRRRAPSEGLEIAHVRGDHIAEDPRDLLAGPGCWTTGDVGARHRERAGPLEDRQGLGVIGHPDPDRRGIAAELPRRA